MDIVPASQSTVPIAPTTVPSNCIALIVPVPLYAGATTVDAGTSCNETFCVVPSKVKSKYVLEISLGCNLVLNLTV